MNVMLLSLLYPRETAQEVARLSKDGLQNQINNYQHAFIQGIDENLLPGEKLDIVNALPVGVFPTRYKKLFLHGGLRDGRIREVGGINLPFFKQKGRELRAKNALLKWVKASEQNRTVLLYTLYLPYMRAIAKAKRKCAGLKAAVIVTDLPNQWGISSGRQGLGKKLEYAMGDERLRLCQALDGFVLLTPRMGEVLPIQGKPRIVMEGLILNAKTEAGESEKQEQTAPGKPAVLYSGTLNRELGLQALLDAFVNRPQWELWLCGKGDMAAQAAAYAEKYDNIRYYGFLPQPEALQLQAKATLLINPRSPKGVFTRYSFPSKTLEYMRSGRPVLCYPLEGIPPEYDEYLYYIKEEGAEGIRAAVEQTLALGGAQLALRGKAGRDFVLETKNPKAQCEKLVRFLRDLA